MGFKDNFVSRRIPEQSTTLKSNRRLKNLLRSLRKTSDEQLEKRLNRSNKLKSFAQHYDLYYFGQRIVLRRRKVVSIELLVGTHQ